MTKLKILDSLEQIIKLTLDLHSILIIDKDGVKMINAGKFEIIIFFLNN